MVEGGANLVCVIGEDPSHAFLHGRVNEDYRRESITDAAA